MTLRANQKYVTQKAASAALLRCLSSFPLTSRKAFSPHFSCCCTCFLLSSNPRKEKKREKFLTVRHIDQTFVRFFFFFLTEAKVPYVSFVPIATAATGTEIFKKEEETNSHGTPFCGERPMICTKTGSQGTFFKAYALRHHFCHARTINSQKTRDHKQLYFFQFSGKRIKSAYLAPSTPSVKVVQAETQRRVQSTRSGKEPQEEDYFRRQSLTPREQLHSREEVKIQPLLLVNYKFGKLTFFFAGRVLDVVLPSPLRVPRALTAPQLHQQLPLGLRGIQEGFLRRRSRRHRRDRPAAQALPGPPGHDHGPVRGRAAAAAVSQHRRRAPHHLVGQDLEKDKVR